MKAGYAGGNSYLYGYKTMSTLKNQWVRPNLATGTRTALIHDVDTLPQAGLPERTHIRVQEGPQQQDMSISRFNGALTRSVRVHGDMVTVDFRNGPAIASPRHPVSTGQRQVASAPVADLLRDALARAFADHQLSPQEALALERLRQSVSAAIVDGRFDAGEIRAMQRHVAHVGPATQR